MKTLVTLHLLNSFMGGKRLRVFSFFESVCFTAVLALQLVSVYIVTTLMATYILGICWRYFLEQLAS